MMSQRGGEKWQKILWRDTPIIMNDGQAISWYAKVLFVAVCMSSYSLFLYFFCSFFPIISCWCYLKVSMIVFFCMLTVDLHSLRLIPLISLLYLGAFGCLVACTALS
jgi:hypothetical protein